MNVFAFPPPYILRTGGKEHHFLWSLRQMCQIHSLARVANLKDTVN